MKIFTKINSVSSGNSINRSVGFLGLLILLFVSSTSYGQTAPGSVFDLSTGSWTLTGWNASVTAGLYPVNGATGANATTGVSASSTTSNMRFWKYGTSNDPLIANASSPTADYTGNYTVSTAKIYGNGVNGIAFDNQGGVGFGSAVLSVNATGRKNIQVAWTGRTITSGARTYGLRLMYRVGTTGSFLDANATPSNIFFAAGTTGTSGAMPTVTLPSAADNAATVQIMWYFYNEGTTTSGTRPVLGLDEITVSSSSNSPTVNGTITAGEYGTHTDGSNQQSSATGTWYMTSDNTNLYIGVSGANVSEASIIYLDKNPIVPVNGGTNSDGTLVGNLYDGSNFANLQFRADLVVYFKDGYQEYRTSNGSNGWNTQVASGMTYVSNGLTSASGVREIAIPWSVIGGKPSSYNWFGHVAYTGGGAYASVPTENPGSGAGTTIGNAATWDRYYTVSTTGTTLPFSRNSYTFTRSTDATSFGAITAFDFTMNSSGRFISRTGNVTGNWVIGGNMVVGAGTIYQGSGGSGYGTTSIAGNLNLLGGSYNLDQTTAATTVTGNVSIASGATLALSGTSGGDINLAGSWTNNGTFTPNSRAVTFNGASAQTLTGATIFDFLTMNGAGGLTLQNNAIVNRTLTLTTGNITLGANNLTIAASPGTISGGTATSYVIASGTGALVRNSVTNAATSFPVGLAASYTPLTVTNTGTTNNLSLVVTSPPSNAVSDATKIVNLEWNLNSAGAGAVGTIAFNWNTANQNASYTASGQGELGNYTTGPNYAITSLGTMSGQAKTVSGVALSSGNNKLIIGNTGAVYAIPPSNDNCSGATTLTLDAAAVTGNVTNATQSLAAITCGLTGTANDDVWYSFTTTGAGTYTITVTGASGFDSVVDVRSGACNGTNIFCADSTAGGGIETVTATGLAASTTYYVRVYDYGTGTPTNPTFTIAVTSPPATLSTNGTTTLTFSTTQAPLTQSASQTFNLSGANLTGAPGNITVTAPSTDFQVSNNNSTWGATALIAYSTGTLASTPVYVRFSPQSSGAKSGNITFSGGGTSGNPTIALTGTAVLPAPTANAATNIAATSFDANWTAVTGASSGYLLDVSTSLTFGTSAPATLSEGFETGMPTVGYSTGSYTLGSGSWSLVNILKATGANVNGGTGGCQLQGGTSASATSPALNNVGTLTFYAKRGATATNLIVQKIVGGITTTLQTITLTTTMTQYTINVNDASSAVQIVFLNGAAVSYVDDVAIGYTSVVPDFVTGYNAKPISGQATVTSSVTGLTADTIYYYRLRATDGTPSAYSNTITVNPASRGGSVASDQTICSGTQPAVLTLSGNNGTIVKWQKATNTSFTGATDINVVTATINGSDVGNLTATTYVRAVVQSYTNPTANSTYATITVTQSPTFGNLQSPASGSICQTGTFDTFGQVYQAGVTEAAGAGAGITAQFGYNTSNTDPSTWTNWSNATFNAQSGNNDEYKYTFTPPGTGTYYYTFRYRQGTCNYVYGGYNGGFWNGTSNVNGSLVVSPTAVAGTATASQTICSGTVPTALSLAGSAGSIQWQSSSDNNTFNNISGQTSATLTIGTLTSTTYYKAILSSGGCTGASSNVVTVTVIQSPTYGNLQSPASGTICQTGTFNAYGQVYQAGVTEAAGAGAGITAQFGYSTSNTDPSTWTNWSNASFNTQVGNNDEYTYSFNPPTSGTYYYTFRYRQGTCNWLYGGYNGGFWNGTSNINGVLTVNPSNTAGTASSTPTLCINTTMNGITHTTSGANGIGTPTGLPSGISAAWSSNTITISGTPTASGTFNYSIPLTGGCGSVSATGTITVRESSTSAVVSGTAAICAGSTTNLQISITGGTSPYTVVYSGGTLNSYTSGTNIPVTPGTSTSYTLTSVTDANGCAGTGNSGTANVTIDLTTSTDGGLNWSNGTPSASKSVVFDGSTGTIATDINACSLRLRNNAAVTVNANLNITLTGAVNVESGSSFTLNNNTNLMQSGTNYTNTGNVTVKRNSSAIKRLDYTLWSSPVTGQGVYAFSPFTFANRFYVYVPLTNQYNNPAVGLNVTNLNSDGVNGTDSNNVLFATGKGYLIRTPWNHPTAPAVWNGSFTGVPHNGDIPVTVSMDGEPVIGYGYNAVGNPYPSRLNVHNFIDGNNNISGTLYFWRKTNDNSTNSYATLTKTAYVANGAAGGDTGTGFFNTGDEQNWVINIGQGFFVKATGGSTINFANSMRRSTNANQFFKGSQVVANTVNNGLYWLNLNTQAGVYSQMAVGYSPEGTLDFDRGIDGANINKDFYLTSLIGAEEYSIQGRPEFQSGDIVPLSYKVTTTGNYTVSIDHVFGRFGEAAQPIYLKDNLTATEHNLQNGPYSFTSEAGTFASRFEIVYESQLGVENPTFTANNVIIYSQNNDYVVNSGNTIMASVKVFDIRGRLLLEKTGINSNQTIINGSLANEMLLVQITSQDGVVVTKKVVR